jgi:hypothetical protein
MPGSFDSPGPATFRISIFFEHTKIPLGLNLEARRNWVEYSLLTSVIDVQHRFPELVGKFQSQLGTALIRRLRLKITVPSLFSMFLLVRAR